MKWSEYFLPTLKETPSGTEAISHQLLLRAGLVHMLTSGVYTYLPLGYRVLRKIENIIREEMNAVGAQELFMPCLQPIELWKKTGRDETLKDVMIRFEDKRKRHMCLGPTHEEVITEIVKDFTQSYRQLPVVLYQIQTKFRDETRPRFGIVRACEFIMKDAYSFDKDKEGMQKNYQRMYDAYNRIFQRCELETVIIEADSGAMGGDVSHEFLVPAQIGEDEIFVCSSCQYTGKLEMSQGCPKCGKSTLHKQVAIEIGHIFQLGTKYSKAQQAVFLNEKGEQQPIIMGCYGIGVSRLIATIIEKHYDEKGIIWPFEVAPFHIEILPLQTQDKNIMGVANEIYKGLLSKGLEVLLDDRDETTGVKFNDADLIGIPWGVIIGPKNLKEGKVEIKNRKTGQINVIPKENLLETIENLIPKRV